jgi:hypothetical protein
MYMKRMLFLVLAASMAGLGGMAQLPGLNGGAGGATPGSDFAVLSKVFGTNTAFSCKADVRVTDKNQKETISVMMDFALLDGKFRMEVDATKVKNQNMPPGAADGFKQMGLDQIVTVIRPDRKMMYAIFPKISSYLTMPIENAESVNKSTMKIEKVGEEKIWSHLCVKNKMTITSDKGQKQEVWVWNAPDLKDFPLQTVTKQDEDTVTTRYSLIQFVRPDAKSFEAPMGFEAYDGIQAFTAGMMKRITGTTVDVGAGLGAGLGTEEK